MYGQVMLLGTVLLLQGCGGRDGDGREVALAGDEAIAAGIDASVRDVAAARAASATPLPEVVGPAEE
jgi:hypothetical protein